MQTLEHMKQFVEPQSVALIGISRATGEGNFNILENLLDYSYQGRIYPINPNVSEILGVKTYPSILDVGKDIDLAIIATPRILVPHLVKECTESNVKSITIVGQGFSDACDEQGKQLQREINYIAQSSHARILGPNTLGTANAFINFNSAFMKTEMKKEPICLICQSGTFFVGIPGIPLIGKGIDLGNACDISFTDSLEYFENDPETKVAVLHIEGIQDVKRFINTAKRITKTKPIIALKTGKTEQSAMAAVSHTGSLTGKDEVWETALCQAGIIRVNDMEELLDTAKAFSTLPLMKEQEIVVFSFSGAVGIITIDACQEFNLNLTELSSETKKRLAEIFPDWLSVGNPIDIWPAVMVSQPMTIKPLRDSMETVLSNERVGAIFFTAGTWSGKLGNDICQLFEEMATIHEDKAFVICPFGPYSDEAQGRLQATGKIATFPTPERAIRALARLSEYSRYRRGL